MIEKGRKWNGKEGEMEAFKRKYKPPTTKPRQPIGQRYGMVKMLHGKLSHIKNSYHRRTSLSSDKPPISLKGN